MIRSLGRWGAVFGMMLEELNDKYNIAPTAKVFVFTKNGWVKMRWGLVPAWSKEPATKYSTFNARVESFTEKPAFRGAWQEDRRCLIPVSGYYEWKKQAGKKIPFFIRSTFAEPLVFAGLWERWHDDQTECYSCTILTTASQGELARIHQRMPVILEPDQAKSWLDGKKEAAMAVVQNPSSANLRNYPVSADVGNSSNQGSSLIVPRR